MRYAQGGGLTAEQRAKREQVRLRAAELFAHGCSDAQVEVPSSFRTVGYIS
jgi:hypothetical protein